MLTRGKNKAASLPLRNFLFPVKLALAHNKHLLPFTTKEEKQMKTSKYLIAIFPILYMFSQPVYSSDIIQGCVLNKFGLLRIVDSPTDCRRQERPISWNAEGPAGPEGPEGSPGPTFVGSVAVVQSIEAISTPAGGPTVEIPGLTTTISVNDGSLLWVQGDFHEHRFCDGYLDRSHITESWALDLEVDGVVVASRELHGEQGNLFNHESKPFTWVSDALIGKDYSVRFLLRPPISDTVGSPPNQAKVCLGTDGTSERQSRAIVLELPR